MGFAIFLNIVGSVFAIFSIVLYGRDLAGPSVLSLCDRSRYNAGYDDDACRRVASFAQVSIFIKDKTAAISYLSHLIVNKFNEMSPFVGAFVLTQS